MAHQILDNVKVVPGGEFHNQSYFNYWGKWHNAIDFEAVYVPVYAWTDLQIIEEPWGNEGGHWLYCKDLHGNKFRLAHLKEYKIGLGWVKEGSIMAISGNSGSRKNALGQTISYKPHLHVEWIKSDGTLGDFTIYYANLVGNDYMGIITNTVQHNRQFLSDIQNGVVAYGFDVGRGKPFKIANNTKEYFNSINDMITHDLCLGMTSENADKIPNK